MQGRRCPMKMPLSDTWTKREVYVHDPRGGTTQNRKHDTSRATGKNSRAFANQARAYLGLVTTPSYSLDAM